MVRSKIGNTDNVITAGPLVFSIVIWNYMQLGFECCHLKKIVWKVKLDLLLVPQSSSAFSFPLLSNSDCI